MSYEEYKLSDNAKFPKYPGKFRRVMNDISTFFSEAMEMSNRKWNSTIGCSYIVAGGALYIIFQDIPSTIVATLLAAQGLVFLKHRRRGGIFDSMYKYLFGPKSNGR